MSGPYPSNSMPADSVLADLSVEVAQLRDLFQRRLLEDKARSRLYDELCEQLNIARGALAEQLVAPLFRELLLVVDRVTHLAAEGDVVLESISEELLELLGRRDVRAVPTTASFDPTIHEAVRSEPSDQPPGTILGVTRPGYLLGTKLLRAERVVVAASRVQGGATSEGLIDGVKPEHEDPEWP